ncbi:MAG: J domain-containing protein [Pseudomonadota bacterium]
MDDPFAYRVKFTDIRVKPPASDTSRRKAKETRVCEHDGCDLAGEHRAPKKKGRGHHYFCQAHAAAYNRSFNFFEGMTEAEAAAFNDEARYDHKKTWKFGSGPVGAGNAGKIHNPRFWRGREMFEDGVEGEAAARDRRGGRTPLQIRALNELDLEGDASADAIRARYAEYVRRFHPDSNGGDRSSEHKLARVLRAGKTLKAAGLMK